MKIGITGSTCSGKTTFLNYLGFNMSNLRKGTELITERAMECPYPLNDRGGFRTQWWIQSQHILKEYEASLRAEVVITDRIVFDGIPYLAIAPHTQKEMDMTVKTAMNWNNLYPYDYVFYFAPIQLVKLSDGATKFQLDVDKHLREIISYNIPHNKIIYVANMEKLKRCELAFKILQRII